MVNAVMTAPPDPRLGPFARFLLWLSPDHDLALKKHDELVKKMRTYFVRKGCVESEDLAHEVRDRVVKLIDNGHENPNHDALFYTVAVRVWQEHLRKPKSEPLPTDDFLPVTDQETDEKELRAYCLETCLAHLSGADKHLITQYYQARGLDNIAFRKALAAEHGSENTLRVKAHRIRLKLRACIGECLSRRGGD
jgi:DNA-directed RNA polymerase specialized sigma24 family protein